MLLASLVRTWKETEAAKNSPAERRMTGLVRIWNETDRARGTHLLEGAGGAVVIASPLMEPEAEFGGEIERAAGEVERVTGAVTDRDRVGMDAAVERDVCEPRRREVTEVEAGMLKTAGAGNLHEDEVGRDWSGHGNRESAGHSQQLYAMTVVRMRIVGCAGWGSMGWAWHRRKVRMVVRCGFMELVTVWVVARG